MKRKFKIGDNVKVKKMYNDKFQIRNCKLNRSEFLTIEDGEIIYMVHKTNLKSKIARVKKVKESELSLVLQK